MCATPSDAPKQKVRIRFLPEDVVVDAEPGECILDVAERGERGCPPHMLHSNSIIRGLI